MEANESKLVVDEPTPQPSTNNDSIYRQTTHPVARKPSRKGSITKANISIPYQFRHVSHVGWDPETGFRIECDNPQLNPFFQKVGILGKQKTDTDNRQIVYDFLNKTGVREAVAEEIQKRRKPLPAPRDLSTRTPLPPKTASQRLNPSCSENNEVEQHASTSSACGTPDFDNFITDLCDGLIASNIPLEKLDRLPFTQFLSKYCNKSIPSESTIRHKYVDLLHEKTVNEIRNKISGNMFWVAFDVTTNVMGRQLANLTIGILDENSGPQPHLIAIKELDKINHVTIARFVNEGLAKFFQPEPVPTENLLLMLSYAGAYIVQAGDSLKVFYPNMIHLTCFAHDIGIVTAIIPKYFETVDSLVTNMKKVFIKAPLRVEKYKEIFTNIPLPPEAWLRAAVFYAEHFKELKQFITDLDADCAAINKCKTLLQDKQLSQGLSFIKSHFSCFVSVLTELETVGLPITVSFRLLEDLYDKCSAIPSEIGKIVTENLSCVLQSNPGFEQFKRIYEVLNGSSATNKTGDVIPLIVRKMKYLPITLFDVERTLSAYSSLLNDKRQSFLEENFEKYLIVYCFANN